MRTTLVVIGLVLLVSWEVNACPQETIGARIVPAFRHGRAIGFKLLSIRPGSFCSLLGLENEDIVRTLNGLDVSSPDKALELYWRIRSADRLVIALERKGREVVLETTMPSTPEWIDTFPCLDLSREPVDLNDAALRELVRWKRALGVLSGSNPATLDEALWALRAHLDPLELRPPRRLDPWGRPYIFHPARDGCPGCVASRGADGIERSRDDVVLACEVEPHSEARKHKFDRLVTAARTCDDRAPDVYGRLIRLRPRQETVLAWSLGPDGEPDTADDEVAIVRAAECAATLRRLAAER